MLTDSKGYESNHNNIGKCTWIYTHIKNQKFFKRTKCRGRDGERERERERDLNQAIDRSKPNKEGQTPSCVLLEQEIIKSIPL